ncbi:LacI family DNA-binding transcriptional regulator [Schaalia sp. ZJ405]|uniref:LacI family DNA-binding transcriptional regulator n=1 Tax=Schaalia sp. ZJ405 TaxID=2709403 RepID=UPI0013E9DC1E|nr:LacI family DNA-binding transcriptional regulator [Schaalia sp. ZJ405]QPK81950.1 LacI family DNA-binding transcriptional regulator [Schaalia sp. ZJ405]
MKDKKPTSRDVARRAGVSQTTVSYVMSGRRAVAPQTEERVLKAMEQLGYQPNFGARALKSNRSNVIGVVIPHHSGADPASQNQFLVALTSEARRHNYDLLLVTDDEGTEGLRRTIDTALCDGLLIMEVLSNDPRAQMVADAQTPAVFVGIPDAHTPVIAIDADYVWAGQQAVRTLSKRGHRSITFLVPGDETLRDLNFIERFRQGVFSEANEQRIHVDEHRVYTSYEHTLDHLAGLNTRRGDALLLAPGVPTDDWCNALDSIGLTPGSHVSLLASSWDPMRSHTLMHPSYFDMRMGELTHQTVTLLLQRIHTEAPIQPDHTLVKPDFHEGETLMNQH